MGRIEEFVCYFSLAPRSFNVSISFDVCFVTIALCIQFFEDHCNSQTRNTRQRDVRQKKHEHLKTWEKRGNKSYKKTRFFVRLGQSLINKGGLGTLYL
jgi:hypothetical protein